MNHRAVHINSLKTIYQENVNRMQLITKELLNTLFIFCILLVVLISVLHFSVLTIVISIVVITNVIYKYRRLYSLKSTNKKIQLKLKKLQ